MTPERWRQLEELYDAVRDLSSTEREARLKGADPELASAVEASWLKKDPSGTTPPGREGTVLAFGTQQPPLKDGDQCGPYEILGPVGAGGMGDVYKARDTRLGRTVAIKVSKSEFSERFEREARAISALNHPHICALYDVGSLPSGAGYMVTELVEGQTLREWLTRPPSEEQSLGVARQVLEALRAAHGAGIVHRDLTPANIMVRTDGYVKVLDFVAPRRRREETVM